MILNKIDILSWVYDELCQLIAFIVNALNRQVERALNIPHKLFM